jgi:hypothetical protein
MSRSAVLEREGAKGIFWLNAESFPKAGSESGWANCASLGPVLFCAKPFSILGADACLPSHTQTFRRDRVIMFRGFFPHPNPHTFYRAKKFS